MYIIFFKHNGRLLKYFILCFKFKLCKNGGMINGFVVYQFGVKGKFTVKHHLHAYRGNVHFRLSSC